MGDLDHILRGDLRHLRSKREPLRCVLCGRFMTPTADMVDVSMPDGYSLDPPDFEWAHALCTRKEDER